MILSDATRAKILLVVKQHLRNQAVAVAAYQAIVAQEEEERRRKKKKTKKTTPTQKILVQKLGC